MLSLLTLIFWISQSRASSTHWTKHHFKCDQSKTNAKICDADDGNLEEHEDTSLIQLSVSQDFDSAQVQVTAKGDASPVGAYHGDPVHVNVPGTKAITAGSSMKDTPPGKVGPKSSSGAPEAAAETAEEIIEDAERIYEDIIIIEGFIDRLRKNNPLRRRKPLSIDIPEGSYTPVDQRSLAPFYEILVKFLFALTFIPALMFASLISNDHGHGHGGGEQKPASEEKGDDSFMPKWEVILSLSNIMIGVCLLSVPFALAQSRATGFLLFAVIGAALCGTAVLFGKCMEIVDAIPDLAGIPRMQRDWLFVSDVAFGRTGALLAGVIVPVNLFCHCMNAILIAGVLLPVVVPSETISLYGSTLVCALAAFALCLLPPRFLAQLSALGAGTSLILIVSMALTCLLLVWMAPHTFAADLSQPVTLGHAAGLIGIFISSLNLHSMLPYFYHKLEDGKEWNFVAMASTVVTLVVVGVLGFLCMLAWGDKTPEIFAENLGRTATGDTLNGFAFMRPACCLLLGVQQLTIVPPGWQALMGMMLYLVPGCPGTVKVNVALLLIVLSVILAKYSGTALPYIIGAEGDLVDFPVGIIAPICCYLALAWKDLSRLSKTAFFALLIVGVVSIIPGEVTDFRELRNATMVVPDAPFVVDN